MKYLLIFSSADDGDREYMMPWYSEMFLFDTQQEAEALQAKMMAEDSYLEEANFYIRTV